jgi:spermidine synthase
VSAEVLDRVTTPRGELVLRRVDGDLEVISNGVFLMDTRDGRSERLLVDAALAAHPAPRQLLIGGLGVGFSLTAAVADARVERIVVVEIEPGLVGWHDGPLAKFSGPARHDPRVEIVVADVAAYLADHPGDYDVVCLDVDNGPDWTVTTGNAGLYDDAGTRTVIGALRPGGVLAVWSAHPVTSYEALLRRHLDDVSVHTVEVTRGEPDVVYVASGFSSTTKYRSSRRGRPNRSSP